MHDKRSQPNRKTGSGTLPPSKLVMAGQGQRASTIRSVGHEAACHAIATATSPRRGACSRIVLAIERCDVIAAWV